ncbi:hypothetical protein F5883DRAFT_530625 [Diaporthe sp. PMI_573]|nr:hypothetical protein F5883DRAFT_530625 [Diaporthaceae sp. PMI_573]
MAPTPEELKKASQATAKGATTTTSKAGATTTKSNAGAGAFTTAKSAAKPANGGGAAAAAKPANGGGVAAAANPAASTSTSSKAGAASTSQNKNDPKTDAPPDWKALRAKVAQNSPKVKGEQITGHMALLKLLMEKRNEQASTTYAAYPKKSVSLDKNKR